MKRILMAAAVAAAALSTAALASDVGVSITLGQPGFYGRLDIGGFPPPPVIYSQPVLVEPVPVGRPPIYLRVPPGHAKHWAKHCREYGACGERVYFVRDDWYTREYAPRYRERYDRDEGRGREGAWEYRHEDEHHEGRGHDHGRSHGHGRGD